jgi:hypothetical protein
MKITRAFVGNKLSIVNDKSKIRMDRNPSAANLPLTHSNHGNFDAFHYEMFSSFCKLSSHQPKEV